MNFFQLTSQGYDRWPATELQDKNCGLMVHGNTWIHVISDENFDDWNSNTECRVTRVTYKGASRACDPVCATMDRLNREETELMNVHHRDAYSMSNDGWQGVRGIDTPKMFVKQGMHLQYCPNGLMLIIGDRATQHDNYGDAKQMIRKSVEAKYAWAK